MCRIVFEIRLISGFQILVLTILKIYTAEFVKNTIWQLLGVFQAQKISNSFAGMIKFKIKMSLHKRKTRMHEKGSKG